VHINRATEELKQCVMLLNRLRYAWWAAGTMADLGTAVLNNADRNTRTANTPSAPAEHPHHPATKSGPAGAHNHQQQHHASTPSNWQTLDNATPIDPPLRQT
jgi:hypothetical protein